MVLRNPWPSLLMLLAVGSSTAYALGHAVIVDAPLLGITPVKTVEHSFPDPTEREVDDIRRALLPKIVISEPLLVRATTEA